MPTANISAMSGLTASNLPVVCGVGRSPAQGKPGEMQYSNDTDMLILPAEVTEMFTSREMVMMP
jgi:hypothetical protein